MNARLKVKYDSFFAPAGNVDLINLSLNPEVSLKSDKITNIELIYRL